MRFTLPATYFTTAQTALLKWGSLQNAVTNVAQTVYLGVINRSPTWEATVYNLTPKKTYYFQGFYEPIGSAFSSDVVAVSTFLGNSFDLGYMPPRPWAFPNPVIVSGVSQPWRQT
jgi:hypothetical protein